MGVTTSGLQEWADDMATLPERAVPAYRKLMSKAGANMKDDWRARWMAMPHRHLPHLIPRLIGYDIDPEKGYTFGVTVGVLKGPEQSRLASFIEYGTLTSGPHPGGQPALDAEAPRAAAAAEQLTANLLEGKDR